MESKKVSRTGQYNVKINGISNKSKDDAVNTAFRNLRAEVSKVVDGLIVYMKPLEVKVTDMETQDYTERFLFLFDPRKRTKCRITLEVTVEVTTITI